jgi:magnesium transporter
MNHDPDANVLTIARREFVSLEADWTVAEAMNILRERRPEAGIVYFYVTEPDGTLVGVLPTRRLLVSEPTRRLRDIMVTRMVKIPAGATVGEACEQFVLHRFLALPVVDQGRIVGVVDVNQFTDEVFDLAERVRLDTVFEAIGLRLATVTEGGVFRSFRGRFPWLLATIAGGTTCALIAGAFAGALEASIVLAFFLTLVLGLGESVAAQSMTVTVQLLRTHKPSLRWFLTAAARELATAALLGLACGALAGATALLWQGDGRAAGIIAGSLLVAMVAAGVLGLTVPAALHALKLDPRIAAGPLALALADLCTVTIYLGGGLLVLTLTGATT